MSFHRTPPKTPNPLLRQSQSVSEPDLSSPPRTLIATDHNITVRNKRPRTENSPNPVTNELSRTLNDFKNEIMEMLASWKADNDERLSLWKAEHDKALKGLLRDMGELKLQCAEIRKNHLDMEKSIKFTSKCYDEIKAGLTAFEKHKKENADRIEQLEKHILDQQLQSRPSTVEFRNIPLKVKETSEDLLNIVSAVGKVINVDVPKDCIRDLYRLPGKSATPRPIVAEFNSVTKRNEFLSNVRGYNKERPVIEKLNTHSMGLVGEKKPIYVDEHLMPSKKKLFYDTRTLAKANKFSCWISYGKIFLRKNPNDPNEKPIQIRSEKCLLSLTEKK